MEADGARTGVIWTGLEKVLVYGVNFAQGILLARMLTPEDFGLTAMLAVFLAVAGIFVEGGFGVALVQDRSFSRADERRVLVLCLGVAVLLAALLIAGAPLLADFYREPRLVPIARMLALTLPLNAPCGIAVARLQRTMRFRKLSAVNVIHSILVAVIAVTLAFRGLGVWVLVWSAVLGSALRLTVVWTFARGIAAPCARSDPASFARLFRFSRKMAATYLLSNVYGNIVPLVLGKLQNPVVVGLYARASSWAVLPGSIATEIVGRVSLPGMSAAQDDRTRFLRIRNRGAWLGLAMLLPLVAVLEVWAAPLVGLVFGDRWLAAVPCLRILLLGAVFLPFAMQNASALSACGRSDCVLRADLVRRPVDFAVLSVGCCFGLVGICWAKVFGDMVDWLVMAHFARRITGRPFLREAFAL